MSYLKYHSEEKRPEEKRPEEKRPEEKRPEEKRHKQHKQQQSKRPTIVISSAKRAPGIRRITHRDQHVEDVWVGTDDGEFYRGLVAQLDQFVNDERGLHRLVDEIPGMTFQLQTVLQQFNIEGVSQMLAEFIKRIGIEEDKDVAPMYEQWLQSMCHHTTVDPSTFHAVTRSMEKYAVEKGLFPEQ